MAPAAALDLWLDYNRRLLGLHAQAPFPLIDFDMPAERYPGAVDALAQALRLQAPAKASDEFFDDGLRHVEAGLAIEVPAPHAALHLALQQAAQAPPA